MATEEETYREGIKEDLSEIKRDQQEIKKMVSYTNGKVRKIIIALVLLSGIVIGLTSQNLPQVVDRLINLSNG